MLSAEARNMLTEACERYADNLTEDCSAYLVHRGIDLEVAATYRLGTCIEPATGHENCEGMLSIPYRTPAGVVAVKFRRIDDGTPKYMGPAGQRLGIYNAVDLHVDSDTIAICEGELDTVVMSGIIGVPAVGVPGVSTWKDHFPKLFEPYKHVLIFADNDKKEDGRNPGMELARRIKNDVEQATIVYLPVGEDVNQVYLERGIEWFEGKLP